MKLNFSDKLVAFENERQTKCSVLLDCEISDSFGSLSSKKNVPNFGQFHSRFDFFVKSVNFFQLPMICMGLNERLE